MLSICVSQILQHFENSFIMSVFEHYNIGSIKSIRFVNTDSVYKVAFIDLYYWNQSSFADELKKKIVNKDEIAKIYYCKTDYWMVYPNVNLDSNPNTLMNHVFYSLSKVQESFHSIHSSPSVSPITALSDENDIEKGLVFPDLTKPTITNDSNESHDSNDFFGIDIHIPLHQNPYNIEDKTEDPYYTQYLEKRNFCYV